MKSTLRTVAIMLMLGLLLGGVSLSGQPLARAQNPATQPQLPTDQKALDEAGRILNPGKRIEALEKFIADFPNSSVIFNAHQALMSLLIKYQPEQKERILKHAEKVIETIPEFGKKFACGEVAIRLVEANMWLEKAAEFSSKALAIAEEEQAKNRRTLPDSPSLRATQAAHQALMSAIFLKKGQIAEAEKAFQSLYAMLPSLDSPPVSLKLTALGLAEVAQKEAKADKVVDYLTTAAIFKSLEAKVREQLETAYRKTHQNSLAGLEEMIDAKYERAFPTPVKIEAYQPTSARTDRTVLAEIFTGSGCGPCVPVELSFEALLERYQRRELVVLIYHQHVPSPDPMTNPSTLARAQYYGVRGVPSVELDGNKVMHRGGTRGLTKFNYDQFIPVIEKKLETKADAQIKLDAVMSDAVIKVQVRVTPTKSDAADLKLQIALVEEKLRFTGENGIRIHPMVVRSLAGENAGGFTVNAAKLEAVSWRFDLKAISQELKKTLDDFEASRKDDDNYTFIEKKHLIDASQLFVVAFVQNEKTKQILQAASVKVTGVQNTSITK